MYLSLGMDMKIPQEDNSVSVEDLCEEFLRNADSLMYKEKKQHKNERIRSC